MTPNRRAARVATFAALLATAPGAWSCTSARMIRYREPDARNQHMFRSRVVRRADAPFQFARAALLRDDLDTIAVRDIDGRRIPWSDYMKARSILGFLVIRNDTILYERYRDGLTESSIHNSFSVAKSVLSALVGAAIADGAIRSLDDPVRDYVKELRGNPAFEGVTVRHLLGMRSGLRFTPAEGSLIAKFRSDEARVYYTTNLPGMVAKAKRVQPPGEAWVYKDTDAELLGLVVARATGKSVAAYTEEKIWRRIGAEHDATWQLDHANGQEKTSTGFNATLRDYARFGRLYLNGGRWSGAPVLPAEWVANSVRFDTTRTEPEVSTWWGMQHTLYWWHPTQPKQGDFFADGSNGQRIYVDPASKTIIVQLANDSRQDFPFRRIAGYLNGTGWTYPRLIPGQVRLAGATYGADSVRAVYERMMTARATNPEGYVITASGMRAAGRLLADDPKTLAAGIATLVLATEYSPTIGAGFADLSDAYLRAGDRERATIAIRRARDLAPSDASIMRKAKALGVP